MNKLKWVLILGLVAAALVLGQDIELGISVEDSYLQESIELMIIREQSRAETRDLKLSALANIEDAIKKGIKGEEILNALEYMALEGIAYKTSAGVRSNYPDVRAKSAAYLGEFPEAKSILIKMVSAEKDIVVLVQVVKSLAKVGAEDTNIVPMITRMFNRFDMMYPDNMLALSCLEAYEQFAEHNGKLAPDAMDAVFRISEGHYHGAIRNRAKQFLVKLRRYSPRNG